MGFGWDDADCEPDVEGRGVHVLHGRFLRELGSILKGVEAITRHVEAGGKVVAHNAAFEFEIWNEIMAKRHGWSPLKLTQMTCTMAMAYAMALPGDLDRAAAAVGLEHKKDAAGHRLMLQMCKPREVRPDGTVVWWDDEERMQRLHEYCRQDVRVERELEKRLMQLSGDEVELWRLDHEINSRGITIDRHGVEAALRVVDHEKKRLADRFRGVTSNFVGVPTEHKRLTEWVNARGVETSGVAKSDIVDLLATDTLPADVREALLIRQEYARSSTAKLTAMLGAANPEDDHLRGMFQYHGAGTGRWAGRKVQLHNLPRPWLQQYEIEEAIRLMTVLPPEKAIEAIGVLYGPPMGVISSCLRGMLVAAQGSDLLAGDFANIEGRMLAWLAGEEWKLQAFRDVDAGTGIDLYILTYAKSFGLDPTKITKKDPRRQVGKVEELTFGFGGGKGAWATMSKNYTDVPHMSDDEVDGIKNGWRAAHPCIVAYWDQLERAAKDAILHPGVMCSAGPVGREIRYRMAGSFLWCRLPSGRVLCYPYPKLKPRKTPWGELRDTIHYMTVDGTTGQWVETHTYGGKLSENVTQAAARDVLADAMKRLKGLRANIVLHVHDEIVVEIAESLPADTVDRFEHEMAVVPPWATGLPIAVEAWRGKRYRK